MILTEIVTLVATTRSFQTTNASASLAIPSITAAFVSFRVLQELSPSKEDALSVPSTLSSRRRSMDVLVLMDTTRTTSVFVLK